MKHALHDVLVGGQRGSPAADRLCRAALKLVGVDAAAISLVDDGESRGTFGASDAGARLLDALQFTAGEGPCLDTARTLVPVLVSDLRAQDETRWPAFSDAAERSGVRGVFAFPVQVGRIALGAIDLFRSVPGSLSGAQMTCALLIADAAAQILLDLIDERSGVAGRDDPLEQWAQVATLARGDVYRATGMIMAQLDVTPAEGLVRLRAYAFSHELTAIEVAELVTSRRLRLEM